MRQHVAKLVPTALLVGGCSLIYNPSNIDKPTADARMIDMGETPIDVEIRADAMPGDLELTEAFPTTVHEGVGTSSSRFGVVVLRGRHFVKTNGNLTVTVTPETQGAAVLDSYEVSGNGDYISLSVVAPVTTMCEEGAAPVNVDVTVAQNDGAGGTVSKTLDNAFTVTCLDQLTAAPASATDLRDIYSVVNIAGTLTLGAAVDAAIIRSASTITLGAVDVSGVEREAGPGGGRGGGGGAGGTLSQAPGTIGEGPKPGSPGAAGGNNGGGGGYAMTGTAGNANGNTAGGAGGGTTGDIWIASYATNKSSGGGGGGGVALSGGDGGAGGGGGGTLELTAPGAITVGNITANGGNGATGSGGDGGAGSGGTVLIRGGALLTTGTVSAAKGMPGTAGGAASDGRIRVDSADGAYPANATKGPMFVGAQTRYTIQTPEIQLRGTPNDATATLRVFDKMGNAVGGMTYTPVFGTAGANGAGTAKVMPTLKAGYNKICVWVAGGSPANAESINCVETTYLPL